MDIGLALHYYSEIEFRKRLAHFNIDEAHYIFFAGMARFGLTAFRPTWGRFEELKITLPKTIYWHCFTATCPPHVQKHIRDSCLRTDYTSIKTSVNRINTIYTRHCIVGTLEKLENYLCLIHTPFPEHASRFLQPRILVFFDSSSLARTVARFLNRHLPQRFQDTNFVMHYYSTMSPEYLTKAHEEFTRPDGACRILCATSAESLVRSFFYIE
jgi:superfamily II DNA helicase RecQ